MDLAYKIFFSYLKILFKKKTKIKKRINPYIMESNENNEYEIIPVIEKNEMRSIDLDQDSDNQPKQASKTKKNRELRVSQESNCSKCKKSITTNIEYKYGKVAYAFISLFFCCFGCCCLCFIPCCGTKFKEAHHTCPKCRSLVLVQQPFNIGNK